MALKEYDSWRECCCAEMCSGFSAAAFYNDRDLLMEYN